MFSDFYFIFLLAVLTLKETARMFTNVRQQFAALRTELPPIRGKKTQAYPGNLKNVISVLFSCLFLCKHIIVLKSAQYGGRAG